MAQLSGKKIAILVTDGFEQVELTEPKAALEQAGARTVIVAPAAGEVKGWQHTDWGDTFPDARVTNLVRLIEQLKARNIWPVSSVAGSICPVNACGTRLIFAPHPRQKLAPSRFWVAHFGQYIRV